MSIMTTIFMNFRWLLLIAFISIFSNENTGQARIIQIVNPSFEGRPIQGGQTGRFHLKGWWDCGFKGETPPDVQAGSKSGFFDVMQEPFDGNTYVGMVVRANNTYERISQSLANPMIVGQCYRFEVYLSRSSVYKSQLSGFKDNPDQFKHVAGQEDEEKKFDFVDPCVLRIWGGSSYCNQRELLAESVEVINKDWMLYEFHFKPKYSHSHFELEVYYKTPIVYAYNGNILLDKASNIYPVPCPEDELLYTSVVKNPNYEKAQVENKRREEIARSERIPNAQKVKVITIDETKPKEIILKELSTGKLKKGQKIKIDKLFFKADSSSFDTASIAVLNEIYHFLETNPEIKLEIGGHTNGIPPHAFCDTLSTHRAKNVYDFLIEQGISKDRISYKGYGKREPLASDNTAWGKRKNQRVELKIISLK